MTEPIYSRQDQLLKVQYTGRIDTATAPALQKDLMEKLDGIQDVVMDFASVVYISSGGLRMVMFIDAFLKKRGGSLKLIHVNEYILDVFRLVGYTDVVEGCPD